MKLAKGVTIVTRFTDGPLMLAKGERRLCVPAVLFEEVHGKPRFKEGAVELGRIEGRVLVRNGSIEHWFPEEFLSA